MQLAVISPIVGLKQFSTFGNIDMALTHLVLESDEYADFYLERSKQGYFIILDNSAFELEHKTGKGFDPSYVVKSAERIQASELICTDVLYKKDETLESTKEFLKFIEKNKLTDDYKFQAVPQGETEDEWLECYEEFYKNDVIDTIGLSKLSVPLCFGGVRGESLVVTESRLKCVDTIVENNLTPSFGQQIHLLGGDDGTPYELYRQSRWDWIRSNDTSAPVNYGLKGVTFSVNTGLAQKFVLEKPDLEGRYESTESDMKINASLIYRNISIFYKFMTLQSDINIS